VITALIALIMEAESTSETSVNFYQTTQSNNPEDSHFHTRRRENLKSLSAFLFPYSVFLYHCDLPQVFLYVPSLYPQRLFSS
jgi:hypothetical protein